MILLFSVLFICFSSLESTIIEIPLTCHNETDFYTLLYKVCTKCVLCRELYYLEAPDSNITSLARERDFRKFHYQLSLILFFTVIDNSTSYPPPSPTPHHHHHHQNQHYHHHGDGTQITSYIYPEEWAPNITVTYIGLDNSSLACSDSFNMTDSANLLFIYTTLDIMKSYKEYISNEHYCNDYNERAIFDPVSGEFHCICMSGKMCYKEGNWREMIFLIVIIQVILTFILYFGVFIVGTRLLHNE